MNLVQLLLFLVVAFIAGTAANSLMGHKQGTTIINTFIGIVGAFVGQFIFKTLGIQFTGALNEGITLGEVLIAVVGAMIVLYGVKAFQNR